MIIRTATINDACAISQLLTHAADQFFTDDFSEAGLAKFKADFTEERVSERLNSPAFTHYVLEVDSEIIAICAIRNPSHLYSLFTCADHHRQGLAKMLWQHVAHELRGQGVTTVTVNASNYAVPAYEKLGFVRVDEMKTFEGIPFNPMVSELSS